MGCRWMAEITYRDDEVVEFEKLRELQEIVELGRAPRRREPSVEEESTQRVVD